MRKIGVDHNSGEGGKCQSVYLTREEGISASYKWEVKGWKRGGALRKAVYTTGGGPRGGGLGFHRVV